MTRNSPFIVLVLLLSATEGPGLATILAAESPGARASAPQAGQGQPAWPSLQSQLDHDHVTPGSALEQLIRSNQDFSLLKPEDAQDEHLPPWLKILWRKAHPLSDPSVIGYPWILYELHEWMVRHQELRPTTPPSISPKQAVLSTGNNIRISGAQPTIRDESDVRVNYRNKLQIIGASNNVANGPQAQFYSADGGVTWGQTFLPLFGTDVFHGDPAVDWTSDGTAWATTLGINLHGSPSGGPAVEVRAYKSTNGGATWVFDGTVSVGALDNDKEMMWVDHSNSSSFKDNIYVIWSHAGVTWFNVRTSSGWGAFPVQISGVETSGETQGSEVKTNSSGDVLAFWPSGGNRRLFMSKSTDGGAHFGVPINIANTFADNDINFALQFGVPAQSDRRITICVSAGAYKTVSKDLVYATWTDLTGAPGCQQPSDAPCWGAPTTCNVASTCKTRVWFARSTNGGATWSTPTMLNNQASLNDQFNQRLVVDEATGALAIIYYDTVNDPGRVKTDVWYQSSFDDGLTWTTPFKVTTAQTDETSAGHNDIQYGEYNGLSGYDGDFFPTWTDRRSGGNEEIWGAALRDPQQVPQSSSWVSVSGNDGNDCSQATPCRTFSGALTKSIPGAEIKVMDFGDFGPVTIYKAISITAAPFAGIQVASGSAITVNAGPNDKVVLRGLTLDGLGTAASGVSFTSGGSLYVEGCTINGFGQYGIDFAPATGSGKLFVTDTLLRNNGVGATGGGAHLLAATGTGFIASFDGLRAENNVVGLKAETLGTVTIRNSLAASNGYAGFSATTPSGSGSVRMTIENSVSTHNGTYGILANSLSTVTLSNTVSTDNQLGLGALAGGQILSFGNNKVDGNTTDGAPTQTITNR